MKTPEEIKKGLKCCIAGECHSKLNKCPYRKDEECTIEIIVDALARIEQLEYALALMVYQYCQNGDYVTHLHMTAGEHAFAALGIADYTSVEKIEEMLDRREGLT